MVSFYSFFSTDKYRKLYMSSKRTDFGKNEYLKKIIVLIIFFKLFKLRF